MDFINTVVDFFNQILDFINTGIYDLVTKAFAQFVIWATVSMIKAKLYMVSFAWDVAQEILVELNVGAYIALAFSQLDSTMLGIVNFFRIPEAIHIISSALVTRYVMNFIGV